MRAELVRQMHTLAELQRHLLPRRLPEESGWDFAAHRAAGRGPGGDYYDVLPLPGGRVLLLMAGAGDQGAPATALVAMARVVLHSCPLSSGAERLPFCPLTGAVQQPPHLLLGHLNRVLFENTLEEQYLTAFCGLLDPAVGDLHYANAGHPAPLWFRAAAGAVEAVRGTAGLPLGADYRSVYHHKRLELEPGDVLVLYTDGLTAAQNGHGEAFGTARLERVLKHTGAEGAEEVRDALVAELTEFLGAERLHDDVTLLVLGRRA